MTNMWRNLLGLLFLLSLVVSEDAASVIGKRSNDDLCEVTGESAAIVGDYMFISGGSYSFQDGDTLARESSLYAVALNQTFPSNASLSQGVYHAIPMPSGVPYAVDDAPLFSDNTTLYFYNPANTTSNTIWTYNVSTSKWKDIPVASASANPPAPSKGGWVSDTVSGRSFYLGTPDSALSRRDLEGRDIASPGLQMFDTTKNPPQWTSNIPNSPLLSAAEMVYVRSGEAGVLIAFGGVDPNDHSGFQSTTLGSYREMSQIFVYDIASSSWFNVTATGDVPVGRINMCAGVSSAPDDTSFNILIYGGFNLEYGHPANDMFVLSIPSFQWIDVTPKNPSPYGRWEHTCAVWEDAQMIVLGGLMKVASGNGPVVNANGCNSSFPPLQVIDTTQFTLQSQFDPQRSYSVPPAVYNVIGGDYRGISPMKGPKNGFNNSQLTSIFSKTVARVQQPTSFPAVPSATATSAANANTVNSSSSASTISPGAIAGIAVGSTVVFIALVATITTCLVLRHKRRKRAQTEKDVNSYYGKPELDSPMVFSKPRFMERIRHPNMVHEADGRDRVMNEADGSAIGEMDGRSRRIVEVNREGPWETEGRELSAEEAQAFRNGTSRENML